MSEAFKQLLDELETLAKAMPAQDEDDKKILAAAGEDEAEGDPDGEPDGDEGDPGEGEDDEAPLGKSFVALIDGQEVEAVDGTDLVKALMVKLEANEDTLSKALAQTVGLLKAQGEQITMLKADLARIGDQGRGRKAVLSVHEKPATGVPEPETRVSANEVLGKALSAHHAGKITSIDVSMVEGYLGRGLEIPQPLLSRLG